MNDAPVYILGHTDLEIERLQLQASIIGGVTRRLIHESGIVPGMRVLDIGCGAGDVSMLLAQTVGPTGSIVAFDREERAIEAARLRAKAAGYRNIEFVTTTDEALPKLHSAFDAAFGRYVLVHQSDPVAMLRRAAAAVRPGGIIAFHEIALHPPNEFQCLPMVDLFTQICSSVGKAFQDLLPHHDVGGRLISCFEDADLPTPHLIWECVAESYSSSMSRWIVLSYLSMLPHIRRLGLPTMDDPSTLVERLDAALAGVRAQLVSKPQVCAWVVRN